ncbi:ABC transporter ATP-binding protein/permease [Brevibacillus humidisoli]|uniref:ABC transporter ATP-binding protein n=1 Tax=Brevibacillus humidisoli TaxID=2895522 RepID=UPI001E5B3F01|nr:ABC transporter ATP-binding protein [Brevibacillus humidisoli]UFJ39746.1 ABC transporter ATP-binding protein/permease [Brevibacillus humidisoli]
MKQPSVIKRLVNYAKPFQKRIWLALLLLILATAAELSGPFIAKVAIDDHILSVQKEWYRYDAVPTASGEQLRYSRIADSYLVREDWLPPGGGISRGEESQIISEGTDYYLAFSPIEMEGARTFTPLDATDQGRGRYQLTISRGDQTQSVEVLQLTADEVKSLYQHDVSPLLWLVGAYAVLIIVSAGLNYVQLLSLQTTAQRIIQQMRIDLFRHLQKLPVSFFDRTPIGSLVSRVSNDTEAVRELYVSVLATFVQNGVYLLGILVALFILQPELALLYCILIPFLLLLVIVYRRYSSRVYATVRQRLSEMNATINEMVQNMTVVQAFRQERRVQEEFAGLNEEYYKGRMRETHLRALLLRPAVDLLEKLALTLVIWYFGSHALQGGLISFGILYAFVDYLSRFFEPVNMIMDRLSQLQQAVTAAGRVFELQDTPEMEAGGKQEIRRPAGRVEVENLWFAYQGEEYVLKDVSFTVEPGQTVALVGHTGSGKSSLMNLLLGFYPLTKGTITIDGVNVDEIDPKALRRHVGLVLQDPFLFAGDIRFNIRLYDQTISEQRVVEAAKAVRAHDFITRLPAQYAEQVVERGATLSAGQRQLLSFARALAADPAILILDEATASIDSETESTIQKALHVLSSGRTTFMIAHRLSTIQHADLILVLSRGEIVERGTHEQLMELEGLYHKMYLLQQGRTPVVSAEAETGTTI